MLCEICDMVLRVVCCLIGDGLDCVSEKFDYCRFFCIVWIDNSDMVVELNVNVNVMQDDFIGCIVESSFVEL